MQHILIDFENVQPDAAQFSALDSNCHIWLFIGRLQKALPLDLCEALCRFGCNVHFIRIAKTGKNALDFYLAYYLGKISEQDSEALICIFSRDTGFDVLLEHMESNKHCRGIVRIADLYNAASLPQAAEIVPPTIAAVEVAPPAPEDNATVIHDMYKEALQYLMRPDMFRPRSRDNLHLLLQRQLQECLVDYDAAEATSLIVKTVDKLIAKKLLSLGESGLLHYHLDTKSLQEKLIAHIQASQPKSSNALQNTIRIKAKSLGLETDDDAIAQCIAYCEKKQILHRNGDKISYPSATENHSPINNEAQKQITNFLSKFQKNKPKKRNTLCAVLQNLYKLTTPQADALIDELVAKGRLNIEENGKLSWR